MNLRNNKSFDQIHEKIDNIVYLTDNKISEALIIKHEKLEQGHNLTAEHALIEKDIAKVLSIIKIKENNYVKLVIL